MTHIPALATRPPGRRLIESPAGAPHADITERLQTYMKSAWKLVSAWYL